MELINEDELFPGTKPVFDHQLIDQYQKLRRRQGPWRRVGAPQGARCTSELLGVILNG